MIWRMAASSFNYRPDHRGDRIVLMKYVTSGITIELAGLGGPLIRCQVERRGVGRGMGRNRLQFCERCAVLVCIRNKGDAKPANAISNGDRWSLRRHRRGDGEESADARHDG